MMDGGRGQVNIALEVLDELGLNIPVCGMVKDDHHLSLIHIFFLQAGKAQANSSNHWVLLKVIRLLYAVFVPATKIPIKWEAQSSFLK